jgi:hypothetical protein
MKFINFFQFLWVIFALLDPEPIWTLIQNTAINWTGWLAKDLNDGWLEIFTMVGWRF